MATLPSFRRHLPFALTLLAVLLVMSTGLHAQAGGYGPPPLVNLVDTAKAFLVYVLCPCGAVWLLVSAALKASQGHHGAGSGIAASVIGAVVLLSITVVTSYLGSL
jgi:hypothetical protein